MRRPVIGKRTVRKTVRFTEKEISFLEQRALEECVTFSDGAVNLSKYIRQKVLEESGWKKETAGRDLRELNYQIRKIGVNVNQVAAKVNSGYRGADAVRQLLDSLGEVQRLVEEFTGAEVRRHGSHTDSEH